MSVENPYQRLERLQFNDVVEFFKDRGATMPCEACNAKQWEIISNEDRDETVTEIDIPVFLSRGAVGAVVSTCTNCGLLRLHGEKQIRKWLAERQLAKPQDQGHPQDD